MSSGVGRGREVATVFLRHGLDALVDLVDLRTLLPGIHTRPADAPHPGPVNLRHAFEELGTTFIKLGQVLSTRPDIVPPDYETELAKLQDAAPTVPPGDVVTAVERSLDRSLRDAFARFDLEPLASASIGQVHAATLHDGTDVVVKVRRPHVIERVDVDLELLGGLARVAARRSAFAARYDPVGLVREFGATLRRELDYAEEGRNAERVAAEFAGDERVHVPRIFWDHTRADVLTEERIRGTKIDDASAFDARGVDRTAVARLFVDAYLAMVFVHGFFHADPHPGNVFVETEARIGFVDFGMVGSVETETSRGLGRILLALVTNDAAAMADGLLQLGIAGHDVDRQALERDLLSFLLLHAGVPLEEMRVGPLIAEIMRVVRAHRLCLPSDLALLLKTVMMCEGVAAQLDPGFVLAPMLAPYAAQALATPDE